MIILAGKESAKPKLIKLSGMMENYEGDLADVVRATTTTAAEAAAVIPATWQFPRHYSQELGDPFSYILQNIHTHDAPPVVSEFLYNSNTADTDRVNLDEMKRPAANMFSRMLQIAPLSSSSSSHNSPPPILLSNSSCSAGLRISSPRNTGIKRRKSQSKKVVCIPAPAPANSRATGEIVPSDLWAWRKYGQKPIKGSPYPRGYYRCSSSKGCSARKQVERSRTDPNMLVITYTSEHNHPWPTQRNALAGSTRSQPSKINEKPPKQEIENNCGAGTAVEEADHELHNRESDHGFPKMYKPTFTDSQNHERDNFFADLGEIGEDPLNLFQRGFSHIDHLDPLNFYDWANQ